MNADLHHLSGAYAVDALDDAERAAFESHLLGCADCRAEVAELTAAGHSLAALTEATPPPSLRASVLSGISQVRPLPPLPEDAAAPVPDVAAPSASGPVTPRGGCRGTGWRGAGCRRRPASSSLTGRDVASRSSRGCRDRRRRPRVEPVVERLRHPVAGGPGGCRSRRRAGDQQQGRAERRGRLQPPARAGGDHRGRVAAAPEGKTYQLWFVGSDGVARSAGLLTPDADRRGSMVLEGDPSAAAAVGMTVEPAGGSTAPTTDPLVVLALA
jgi:hypothetical protein